MFRHRKKLNPRLGNYKIFLKWYLPFLKNAGTNVEGKLK